MIRKILSVILAVFILFSACGCAALLVGGVVGAGGTAVWLSGKMIQQVSYPLNKTSRAAREALSSSGLSVNSKENLAKGFAQIRSYDTTKEKIWIDIFRISDSSCQIQVRVGTFMSNRESAARILRMILQDLGE